MAESIAYCGLVCTTCPVFLATHEQNQEQQAHMRAEISQMCTKHYGVNYDAKDINDCEGCHSETLFFGCNDCRVRACASQKNIVTCAECSEYACSILEAFFAKDPGVRARLDQIRAQSRSN